MSSNPELSASSKLRFPGDPPRLLRTASVISHLELRVADLRPRLLEALLAALRTARVKRLTCLPGTNQEQDGGADAATLVRILRRVRASLRSLSILCYVNGSTRVGHDQVSAHRKRALKIIVAMPRLRELTLGDMSFHNVNYSRHHSVQVPLEGTLKKLRIKEEAAGSWAKTILNLLRAHSSSLRCLELDEIEPLEGAVVASIVKCRRLTSLSLVVPLPSHTFNLMRAYKNHTRRIYRQLPKVLTRLQHLKLLLPCPFDVDSSADTDDGEGVGLDELAAGLRHYTSLQTMELVVLCGSAQRAEPRVEANEALLRAALPATTDVNARVQQQYCFCNVSQSWIDDFENDHDRMVDTYNDLASNDASSYTSHVEGEDAESDDDD